MFMLKDMPIKPSIDQVNQQGESALLVAAKMGHLGLAKQLHDSGAHVDFEKAVARGYSIALELAFDNTLSEDDLHRALLVACANGQVSLVKLLLAKPIDVNTRDSNFNTPLILAAEKGSKEVTKLLLAAGADANTVGCGKKTVLHAAVNAQESTLVKLLLLAGTGVNAQDMNGLTALHFSSSLGNVEIVKLLIEHGARVNVTASDMRTPLHAAATSGSQECMEILLQHGGEAIVNSRDKYGDTALLATAQMKGLEDATQAIAKCLLRWGANVNLANEDGTTALQWALENDNLQLQNLLRTSGAREDPSVG